MHCRALGTLAALVVLAPAARQAPVVPVSLIPEFVVVRPGTTLRVAVRIEIPDGWHIGWKYPGQSGLPTVLTWRVSPGITASETAWPFPERAETIGTVSHIYQGDAVLITSFKVSGDAVPGAADIVADVRWGICREICIPQDRQVRTTVSVGSGAMPSPSWHTVDAAALQRLPQRPEHAGLEVRRVRGGIGIARSRQGQGVLPPAGSMTFFPENPDRTALAQLVDARTAPTGLFIRMVLPPFASLKGVLVSGDRALLIDLPAR